MNTTTENNHSDDLLRNTSLSTVVQKRFPEISNSLIRSILKTLVDALEKQESEYKRECAEVTQENIKREAETREKSKNSHFGGYSTSYKSYPADVTSVLWFIKEDCCPYRYRIFQGVGTKSQLEICYSIKAFLSENGFVESGEAKIVNSCITNLELEINLEKEIVSETSNYGCARSIGEIRTCVIFPQSVRLKNKKVITDLLREYPTLDLLLDSYEKLDSLFGNESFVKISLILTHLLVFLKKNKNQLIKLLKAKYGPSCSYYALIKKVSYEQVKCSNCDNRMISLLRHYCEFDALWKETNRFSRSRVRKEYFNKLFSLARSVEHLTILVQSDGLRKCDKNLWLSVMKKLVQAIER